MPNMPGMQSMTQIPEVEQVDMQQMSGAPTDSEYVQSHDDMHMGLQKEIEALEQKASKDQRPPDEKNLQTESEFFMQSPYS